MRLMDKIAEEKQPLSTELGEVPKDGASVPKLSFIRITEGVE